MKKNILATGVVLAAALSLTLTGCSNSAKDSVVAKSVAAGTTTAKEKPTAEAGESTKDAAPSGTFTSENLHLHDGFVKALGTDNTMTAVFGMVENHTDKDAHVVSFTTSLGEAIYQLHEVVDGTMQEKKDGFIVPAGGHHMLKPGGDHLMIMNYKKPIEAGGTIDVTLKLANGDQVLIKDVSVRTIAAGDENYGDMQHNDNGDKKDDPK